MMVTARSTSCSLVASTPLLRNRLSSRPTRTLPPGQHRRRHKRHLVAPQRKGRERPVLRHVVDHGQKCVQVVRRAPGHTQAELHQCGAVQHAVLHELFRKPKMAGVEGFDLRLHAEPGHLPAHLLQHAGRVHHHIVGFGEIHRAAVQRADFGQAFADMGQPFAGTDQIGSVLRQRQRALDRACDDVAAHSGGQVQHHVHIRVANAFGDFAVIVQFAGRRAAVRITDMAVHDRSTGPGRGDGAFGDLLRGPGHMRAAILRRARTGNGAGDEDVPVHLQWHLGPSLPYAIPTPPMITALPYGTARN